MSPIATTVGIIAVSESVKLSIKELHSFIATKAKHLVQTYQAEHAIENLYKHVDSIRHIKTIWQIDKAVNLKNFYVTPHITSKEDSRQRITSIDQFNGNSILLEGIAGQGKSTFLRYLCATEMIEGSRIPVFLELRKIKSGERLIDHIIQYLFILGIKLTDELVFEFIKLGKLSLYLDGFDEIEKIIHIDLIRDIEKICSIQGAGKLIVTSRPGQTVRSMACLKIIKLDHLRGDEYKEVIGKISDNQEYAESLITVVEKHKQNIKGMLCTPLFVTLLVISYKSYQQIPEQLSDFYDSLFRVLLQRHDGTKPAYSRTRATKLNDSKFRDAFENFCYLTKKYKNHIIDHEEIIKVTSSAIEQSNIEVDPHDLIKDIYDVTCLIINDGDEWRFIHKSIQEFFSASYVKNTPEIKAQKIYTRLSATFSREWEAELKFLSEIDTYRYAKYFFIPCFKKLVENPSNIDTISAKVTPQIMRNILGCYKTELGLFREDGFQFGLEIIEHLASPLHLFSIDGVEVMMDIMDAKYSSLTTEEKSQFPIKFEININTIMANADERKIAQRHVSRIITELYEQGLTYERMIRRIESENVDYDLFGH
jgi:hypothetical protein